MPIDNPVLREDCKQVVRPLADRLLGLMPIPANVIVWLTGRGFAELLGTTTVELFREAAWEPADYANVPDETIVGTSLVTGGPDLTARQVIAVIRAARGVKALIDAHPGLAELLSSVAVNPQLFNRFEL